MDQQQQMNPEQDVNPLEAYGVNLTGLAREGKIDPVIGREDEIRRTVQILSRRNKNNPVLIGEPGTGKTTVVEGLAKRIVEGDVPENIKNKELISLDLSSMVAGAMYRGQFEQRLKNFVNAIIESDDKIILFIDELHMIVGAGNIEGQMDVANMIKPELARGRMKVIGATTLGEYQKYIEKDAALERRFQHVYISEPNLEDTITILRGIKDKYELHHGLHIKDSALISAASLSDRYISDRFLPDKAVDLMDEAAAKIRMEMNSAPADIDDAKRKLIQLEIEREALKMEVDDDSKDRLCVIEKQLSDLEEKNREVTARWDIEKAELEEISQAKIEIDTKHTELDQAQRRGDLETAARIQYGELRDLANELATAEEKLRTRREQGLNMVSEEVDAEQIAQVVARWTGIPVTRLVETQRNKLLHMEEELEKRVVGQDEAVKAVAESVRRSRAGLGDQNRPIGSFLFLGPTGVGKTELCKALAEFLFDTEEAMVRIDMSEFMEQHAVARLIGSPPGYVGYEEGGRLTEAVRRRPYCVILFDEMEKAHEDVANVLLQVLDEGRLTDGHGRTVDFRNTLIVMTSNLGSSELLDLSDVGAGDDLIRETVLGILRTSMRPELVNRIDEIVVFHQLSKKIIGGIVEIQLAHLRTRLADHGMSLSISESAIALICDEGFDPQFGARPVKRVIQHRIENPIANGILSGKFEAGDTISIDVDSGDFTFTTEIITQEA